MLTTLLKENREGYRSDFGRSYNVTSAREDTYLQCHSWASLRAIFRLLQSSESWYIRPVTTRTPFETTLRPSRRGYPEIFEIDFAGCNLRTSELRKIWPCHWNHEELVFRFLRSLHKPNKFMIDLEVMMKIAQASPPANSSKERRFPEFEQDEDFTRSNSCPRIDFSARVILPGSMLRTQSISIPTALPTELEPKSISTSGKASYISDLLHSLRQSSKVRRAPTLWSSGPREVMRKCQLEGMILSQGFGKGGALLQMTTARDTLFFSNPTTKGEIVMFEKEADALLRTFARNSRSMLSPFVDLCEGLEFSLRQEANCDMQSVISPEKLLDQYYDFDVLKRSQNDTLKEHIPKSGTKCTTKPSHSVLAKQQYMDGEEDRNEDNTSQESALNDILTSDDDDQPDVEPQQIVAQKKPTFQHMKSNEEREETVKPIAEASSQAPQRVRVPENLMCSPWSLKLAEHCVARMPRGTILLPPCLSALPSLCVIINTHLSSRLRDKRVAIICESESDISIGLSSYLEHSFSCKTSVEVVKRWNFPNEPRYPSLNGCTAQILILDSFEFSLPVGVSLLLILVCEPRLICSTPQPRFRPRLSSINPEWPHLESILIAPIDCWVPLSAYIQAAERLSLKLKTNAVVFVADYDDIHTSVLLAKPRALFLVPLEEASELISVIDSHTSASLVELRDILSSAKPVGWNADAQRLQDLSVSFLRSMLEDELIERNTETYRDLETVYYLRQARSYALYDGFDVAIAFLLHCRDELQQGTSRLLQNVMREVCTIETKNPTDYGHHPVVSPVAAHMKRMRDTFRQEPPSLSLTHRRTAFLPLIIADSRETVDGFRRGRTKAKLLFEAGERDIAICWLSDLVSIRFDKPIQEKRVLDRLEEFTHIYHVIDGRESTHSESKFPPSILQLVHAGRTRLITVVVDERRDIESLWTNSHKMYDTMRKHIGDQSRFSGIGGHRTLREMKWEVVTRMLGSLW
ncbi:hypothetical protein FGB62_48g126 [Gracilaria domingensis]|nr:hypothetical protein FGB62_48g126 [Gracilaria domingensis]